MLAFTESTVLLNTAVFDEKRVEVPLTVLGISRSGAMNGLSTGLTCTVDTARVHVSEDCSLVYLDGTETAGGAQAAISVGFGAPGATLTTLWSVTVWYPSTVELSVADDVLNQVCGWRPVSPSLLSFSLSRHGQPLTTVADLCPRRALPSHSRCEIGPS